MTALYSSAPNSILEPLGGLAHHGSIDQRARSDVLRFRRAPCEIFEDRLYAILERSGYVGKDFYLVLQRCFYCFSIGGADVFGKDFFGKRPVAFEPDRKSVVERK